MRFATRPQQKTVIVDDTRSTISSAFRFLTDALEFDPTIKFTVVRNRDEASTALSDESFEIDREEVITWIVS